MQKVGVDFFEMALGKKGNVLVFQCFLCQKSSILPFETAESTIFFI